MALLSKSSYIRSLQCIKSLYLYKNFYHLRDPLPVERRIRFEQGHNIGKLAWQLFPGGVDASPQHISRFNESVEFTKKLVEQKTKVIYEAAFIFNDVLVALDILVLEGDWWKAYEVKSSTSISQTYRNDAALQYYVLNGSGLPLKDFSIIHLYKHHSEITNEDNAENIFQYTSVIEECKSHTGKINAHIQDLRYVLANKRIPQIEMGVHCHQPYTCDFIGLCTKNHEQINTGLFEAIE